MWPNGGHAAATDAGVVNGTMDNATRQQSSGELPCSMVAGTSGELTDKEVRLKLTCCMHCAQ